MLLVAILLHAPLAAQTLQQEILPSNPSRYAAFGNSVAMDGNLLLVGSRDKPVNNLNYAGSGYLFRKVNGTWVEEAWLTAPVPEVHDEMGYDVALSGEVALLGAPDFPSSSYSGTGRAWVFRRTNGVWSMEQELVPSTAYWDSATGREVALGPNVAAVVTPMSWNVDAQVTIFEYSGGTWTETALLQPPVAFADFGTEAVFANNGQLAISDTTAVYIYEKVMGSWQRTTSLSPPPNVDARGFGHHIAFDGARILAGAPNTAIDGLFDAGRVFMFSASSGAWGLEQIIDSPLLGTTFGFGANPSLDGNLAVVSSSEGVHVLRHDGREWVVEPGFSPATLPSGGYFPISCTVSANQAAFGASGTFTPGVTADGGAYVYTLDPPFHLRLTNGPLVANDNFKFDVHGAGPNAQVWLAYSLAGLGSTSVPQLQTTLGLQNPGPVASLVADATGYGSWDLLIPAGTTGLSVWFQAVTFGQASKNILAETIQ